MGVVRPIQCSQWGRLSVRLVSGEGWAAITVDKPRLIRYDKQRMDFLYAGENGSARQANVRPLIATSPRDGVI